jgi:hypothetical protein
VWSWYRSHYVIKRHFTLCDQEACYAMWSRGMQQFLRKWPHKWRKKMWVGLHQLCMSSIGWARTIFLYVRVQCTYGILAGKSPYTHSYIHIRCVYMVLAHPPSVGSLEAAAWNFHVHNVICCVSMVPAYHTQKVKPRFTFSRLCIPWDGQDREYAP